MFGGGSPVDEENRATIPDRWRRAYEWYHSGMWEKHFIPTGDYYERPRFESGHMAMMPQSMWYLPTLADVSFNWDVAAIPSYEGESTVMWHAQAFVVLGSSDHPAEAAEMACMLATSLELATAWGSVPAFKSRQEDFFKDLGQRYPMMDMEAVRGGLQHLSRDDVIPNEDEAADRLEVFRDMISTTPDADIDLEIKRLESDLQSIFDATDSQ